ncbi:hypothetical protein RESH_04135 [Rhodopirellula europaea SH398]|uniref:Uncharacterized protein n=2 Tax=Rhodopirellula europaea TaxID=1263866 RepID=M5SGF1_9BACT|nr:hypothetical protein RE6C_04214 [Rhodopirellula europaea 6C]EMI25259.1 hypothetical protein RESH_04135 [Rhodopirellula europaea SH398]
MQETSPVLFHPNLVFIHWGFSCWRTWHHWHCNSTRSAPSVSVRYSLMVHNSSITNRNDVPYMKSTLSRDARTLTRATLTSVPG